MKRLPRNAPLLFAALLAACQQVPVLNATAPGQGVVVQGPQEGGWAIRLDLAPGADAPGYGLLAESGSTDTAPVHRWVAADLVRYDVELRVRNATTATQFDAVGSGLTAQVPVNGQGAGSATFTKLRPGAYYRAYVKAMGRKGGNAGSDAIVQLNSQATSDHADFDFTGNNDVAQQASGQVTVRLDGVAFSGQGGLAFGSPLPGGYASPTGALGIQPILPPTPTPPPQLLGSLAMPAISVPGPQQALAVDPADGSVWVTGAAIASQPNVVKLTSMGSLLFSLAGNFPRDVAVAGDGSVWLACSTGLQHHDSTGALLHTVAVPGVVYGLAIDSQGQVWTANDNTGHVVSKLSSSGSVLGTYPVGGPTAAVAVDAADRVWVLRNGTSPAALLLSSGGSVLGAYSVGTNPVALSLDAQGRVWVVNQSSGNITLLASNGVQLATLSAPGLPAQVAFDAAGNAWVSRGQSQSLLRFDSSGSALAPVAVAFTYALAIDAARGNLWVTNASSPASLYLLR